MLNYGMKACLAIIQVFFKSSKRRDLCTYVVLFLTSLRCMLAGLFPQSANNLANYIPVCRYILSKLNDIYGLKLSTTHT